MIKGQPGRVGVEMQWWVAFSAVLFGLLMNNEHDCSCNGAQELNPCEVKRRDIQSEPLEAVVGFSVSTGLRPCNFNPASPQQYHAEPSL